MKSQRFPALLPCLLLVPFQLGRPERPVPPSAGELARAPAVLEGCVLAPGGAPAEGAVVLTSAGGKAVTDAAGNWRLEVDVPLDATGVQVTAFGGAGGTLSASTTAPLAWTGAATRLDPLHLALGATCNARWLPTFGAEPGTNAPINSMVVWDDGSGPALFVAGYFTSAGGAATRRVARWNGTSWARVGSGMPTDVYALAVFDDGSGPALYAGGAFGTAGGVPASRVARWNGTSWSALGSGVDGAVFALCAWDDGSGPALYVGGFFATAGGAPASRVARWDGSTWSTLGSGLGGAFAGAMTVHDDGSGPALYVGGQFTSAGATPANHVARWDGSTWSALGAGVGGSANAQVFGLTSHDDGSGPALFVGGSFTTAGGTGANGVARWDGTSWAPLGSGVDGFGGFGVYDEGSGPELFVAGSFASAGGVSAARIARWDGSGWSGLGSGLDGLGGSSMAVFDDGKGPRLYVGGNFTSAGGIGASHLASWDGTDWTPTDHGPSQIVEALAVFDAGDGPELYAAGQLTTAGGTPVEGVARWDGSAWNPVGAASGVLALEVFDDGSGPALFAGGLFATLGGVSAKSIARWDGTSWSSLGSGVDGSFQPTVLALAVHDDGSGPALYVGGKFTTAGGAPASNLARWNGSSWSALGSGTNDRVGALAVHDDGSGAALYAGGRFTTAGGAPASRIARWNGSSWSALGSGTSGEVEVLLSGDLAGGPALFAGGAFTTAGGVTATGIARYDGSAWSALGSGLGGAVVARASALAVHDDGNGTALFVGGEFQTAGGIAAGNIARWDGTSWAPLGGGMNYTVDALATFDDGTGPALHAGGYFSRAFDSEDSYLAKWGCYPDTTAPVIACPASVTVLDDFVGGPGESVSFTVTAADEIDPAPLVVCVPPSGSVFPRGTTMVLCTATDASGNQASCSFPVTVQVKTRRR